MNDQTTIATSTDGTTVVTHTDRVRTQRAVLTIQTMTDGHDIEQNVILVVDDEEPMTARQARETAAALLEAADKIDGRESQVLSLPGQ
ncbi:hypothetical protein DEU31_1898 [Brachybacterium sp. AG952]|uniref:hypothetical protein n=1 Tax=Brachybacterium sp. AG952 TaxID=2183989 RepID=UPI001061F0D4|nr:hypothetical protein [Brachybacterium sp. AG952]TDP78444.1 hypothetical protein DEU31_1898 [Brachybacterium sp. AG952]